MIYYRFYRKNPMLSSKTTKKPTNTLSSRLESLERRQGLQNSFGRIDSTLNALRSLNTLFSDRDKIESTASSAFAQLEEDLNIRQARDIVRFIAGGLDPEGQMASQLFRSRQAANDVASMRIREEKSRALDSADRGLLVETAATGISLAWLFGLLIL